MRWAVLVWTSVITMTACVSAPAPKSPEPVPPAKVTAHPVGERAAGEPESPLPVEADDSAVGSGDAPVTIIGFLDFECGFCAQGFATLDALHRRYPANELRIVMKHLPLDFHPRALPSAVAAQAVQLAAGPEAGFNYARRLFENRSSLDFSALAEHAAQVGVDRDTYNELVGDPETIKRVAADVVLSRRHGVDGTPAFFVNGRMVTGAQPEEVFVAMIEEEKGAMHALSSTRPARQAYAERVRENVSRSLVQALLAKDPHDYRVPVGDSPVVGPRDAPVTMVMFTDFECPYCKRADATVDELLRLYPNELRVVFKHKPLPFHTRARPAALLAAAIQKKRGNEAFFRAAQEIFTTSPELTTERLTTIGKQQGLSDGEITQSLIGLDKLANAQVQQDEYLGDDVEAEGTPHFFINGKRLSGARPVAHFRALIDSELERAKKFIATGIRNAEVYDAVQKEALSPGLPKKLDQLVPDNGRPSRGPARAPVTIHIFSDFQCPFCRQSEQILQKLEKQNQEQLRFVWHDMPLDFHERALPAARAGREAFAQKGNAGFWKMHSLLFSLEDGAVSLMPEDLRNYGKQVGLDATRLNKALEDASVHPQIEADKALAASLGIRGTPAFVVGPYLVTGARPAEHFQRLIDMVLADKSTAPAPAAAKR